MAAAGACDVGRSQHLGLRSGDALIVVDVQRDFLPGGRLAVPHGEAVVEPLNAYMAAFHARQLPVFLTRDWHPPRHCSFKSQGGPWPEHCVRESSGAAWAPTLTPPDGARIVSKGVEAAVEAYSGFSGTSLAALLRERGVQRVFVGGLATDYCVRATVLDARALGFDVVVLSDAVRGVNVAPGDDARALEEMMRQGATLATPSLTQ